LRYILIRISQQEYQAKREEDCNGWRSVHKIFHLFERDWVFTISPAYLEANMCAELANHGSCGNTDLIMYDDSPDRIRKRYIDDA